MVTLFTLKSSSIFDLPVGTTDHERFGAQDLSAEMSYDFEGAPTLSLTAMVGIPQPHLFVTDSCIE